MWFFKDREEMMSYVLEGLSGMGGEMLTKTVGRLFNSADDKDFLIRLETSLQYALDRAGHIFMEHLGRKRAAEVEDKIDIDSNTLNFSVVFCPARETLKENAISLQNSYICRMCRGYIQAKAERLGFRGPVKLAEEQDACKFYFEGEKWM